MMVLNTRDKSGPPWPAHAGDASFLSAWAGSLEATPGPQVLFSGPRETGGDTLDLGFVLTLQTQGSFLPPRSGVGVTQVQGRKHTRKPIRCPTLSSPSSTGPQEPSRSRASVHGFRQERTTLVLIKSDQDSLNNSSAHVAFQQVSPLPC